MKIYLLTLLAVFALSIHAQKCQQLGSSSLAKLGSCRVTAPAPKLQWTINVTLLQDYNWLGPDDISYVYMTLDDHPISETCYQGQTIKGKYSKGASLMIEHLCFGFSPVLSRGSKLYLYLFSSQGSSGNQIVYMTFNDAGEWEVQEVTEEIKAKAAKYAKKNLVTEQ